MEAHREVEFHGFNMIRYRLGNKGLGAPMDGGSNMSTEQILARAKTPEAVLDDMYSSMSDRSSDAETAENSASNVYGGVKVSAAWGSKMEIYRD